MAKFNASTITSSLTSLAPHSTIRIASRAGDTQVEVRAFLLGGSGVNHELTVDVTNPDGSYGPPYGDV
jgi:hypothetical protein